MKVVELAQEIKNKVNIENVCDALIWCLTVSLIPVFGLFDGHYLIQRLMYGITGIVGCLILLKEKRDFRPRIHIYHVLLLLFIASSFISGFVGWDKDATFSTTLYMLKIIICMSVFYYHYEQKETIEPFLQALKWGGYVLTYLCLYGYGFRNVIDILLHGGRVYSCFVSYIGGETIPGIWNGLFSPNINLLGYFVAIPAVIGMYDIIFNRKNTIIEIVCILPSLLFLVISGGKLNFILLLAGLFLILLLRTKGENLKKTLCRWGVLFGIIVVFLYVASFLPMFQDTISRFQLMIDSLFGKIYEVSTNERMIMIQVGLEQFFETPVFGIGLGNTNILLELKEGLDTYLHCNYAELLAGVGAVGTIVFYTMYFYPLYCIWKYRKEKDKYAGICLVLILTCLIADVASVTYSLRVVYLYFGLFFVWIKSNKDKSLDDEIRGK